MIEYSVCSLGNGLRVVHHRSPGAATVAVNVLYNVGARDEDPEHTGMAHLFEHLMFGGSANIADFDGEMELAGGWNNAWTSNDFTNFYSVIPKANINTALWLESDRMLRPAFSAKVLEVQRKVVIEEFKQTCLNRPYGDMNHYLRGLLYKVHPYRWPTIGLNPEQIAGVTGEDVERFFYAHYGPDNAVLAIAGDLEADEAFALAEKWFGDIPARHPAERRLPAEPPIEAPRELTAHGHVESTAITIAFPMAARGGEGYEAADIITDIFSTGVSSRFKRGLLKTHDIFTEADAAIAGSEDPGYLAIGARLRDADPETARRAIDILREEIDKLIDKGVGEDELERVLTKFESTHKFSATTLVAKAQNLAMAVMTGTDPNSTVARYRKLTPDHIAETARRILRREGSVTLTYLPV
ncbi:MAG: insulinase family protein [Paramuribaculum sp.]|nr:insulinase family protein [Paramuribaculum sp.]